MSVCTCGHGSEEHVRLKGKYGVCHHILTEEPMRGIAFNYVTFCPCREYERRRRGPKFQSSTFRESHESLRA